MNKGILVTGASGFLGGRTAKHLAAAFPEYRMMGTSRRNHRKEELLTHGSNFEAGDLCSAAFCDQLTKGQEIVIHCAALSSPFGPYQNFYQSNVIATQTLLDAAINNGVKQFIFISTPSIYFNFSDRFNVSESDVLPKKMVNHYAQTKYLAEQLVLQKNGNGIQTLALRPRAIIGAEDSVLFPRMLEAYHQGKLRIIGDGKNVCDFTCVRNVIEAIICAMKAPESAYGEAYNITDGEASPFWETLAYALHELGLTPPTKKIPKAVALAFAALMEGKEIFLGSTKEPALTRYGVGVLANNFTLNIEKAKTHLHYQPKMKTMEGINEYLAWHRNQK